LLKVGLIGCGAIGGSIGEAIAKGNAGNCSLSGICDIDVERMQALKEKVGIPQIYATEKIMDLLQQDLDLVVEAANQSVVERYAEEVLKAGKNLLVMSVGALRNQNLFSRLETIARTLDIKIFIPSGAICGLDGVSSAAIEDIMSAEITSTKNPKSLEGAPYLIKNNVDLSRLQSPSVIYEGTAREAAEEFPKNVNVAAAFSLAGIGVDETRVKIIADPKAIRTMHEIRVIGDFGDLYTRVRNVLHPDNPKTSYLAVLAAIKTLKKITEPIQFGS
jgi:aspartate dehydrogenase